MHSGTIWTLFLEAGNAEKTLKARTIDNTFWHYLTRYVLSWSCWEIFKARTQNGAFWRYLKRCFGSWNCWENVESKGAKGCILTLFVIEVGTAEKKSKAKTQNVAFWGYLKRCLKVWTAEKENKQGHKNVHSDASWNDVYRSLKCRENVDTKGKMVHSGSIWKDVLELLKPFWKQES